MTPKQELLANIMSILHCKDEADLRKIYATLTPGTKTVPAKAQTKRQPKKNITVRRNENNIAYRHEQGGEG